MELVYALFKMKRIKIAQKDEEIVKCYAIMAELRPDFQTANEFLVQVNKQRANYNFQMVYLKDTEVKAVGGIRIAEWLAGGKYLEIEDLVAKENERSKGYGGELFDWIVNYARRENCNQIKLVSHVKRYGAHKFYLNKRMIIEAHYFSLAL
jgi:GNAT superfamily N-acetyltransferase